MRLSHPQAAAETSYVTATAAAAAAYDDAVVLVQDEDVDSGPMECVACAQLFENRAVLRRHRQYCAEDVDGSIAAAEAQRDAERRVLLTGQPMAIEVVYVKQEVLLDEELMVDEKLITGAGGG